MDLDQAMYLERDGDGYVVHYAIADVAAFVDPGGAIDTEAHRRGETLYGADSKIPLHPHRALRGCRVAAARPGAAGAGVADRARRARDDHGGHRRAGTGEVTAKLSYDGVQADLDAGTADADVRDS